jgi:hypothetical protein
MPMADDTRSGPVLVKIPDQKNDVAAAGDSIRRHLDDLIENHLAYLGEGFTEAQALELCYR